MVEEGLVLESDDKKDKTVSTSREIVNATIKPTVQRIEINLPSITIITSGTPDNIERENIYPATMSSSLIAIESTAELGIPIESHEQEKLINSLEMVKETYVSEIEIAIAPVKFKIKRSPRKIIKSFKC